MNDPELPNYDNPISKIFSSVLGQNKKIKNLNEYLSLTSSGYTRPVDVIGSVFNPTNNTILSKVDKNRILPNANRLRAIGFDELSTIMDVAPGTARGRFFNQLSQKSFLDSAGNRFNPILLWDQNNKALFFGHESVGFAPLPTRRGTGLGSNIVHMGYNQYASSTINGTHVDEVIYRNLDSTLRGSTDGYALNGVLNRANSYWKMQTGSYGINGDAITVGTLFKGGNRIRGGDVSLAQSMFGLRDTKGFAAWGNADQLGATIRAYKAAQKELSYITKVGRSSIEGANTVQEFKKARRVIEQFPRMMYEAMGDDAQYYPYVSAKHMLGDGMINLPTSAIRGIFGDLPMSASALTKGLYQEFKIAPLSSKQGYALGARSVAPFYLQSYYDAAKGSGVKNALYRGSQLRIGVMDFEDPIASRVFTQEGGLIRTGTNAFDTEIPVGEMRIRTLSGRKHSSIEQLFGVNLAHGTSQPNSILHLEPSEVNRALDGSISYKSLSERERRIREVAYNNKSSRGLFKRLAGRDVRLTNVSMRGDDVLLSFHTPDPVSPNIVEAVIGSRRFSGGQLHPDHEMAVLAKHAKRLGVDALVSTDEFYKMYHDKVFLENFFAEVTQAGKLDVVMSQMGLSTTRVHLPGRKSFVDVPLVNSAKDAHAQAIKIVSAWAGGTKDEAELANRITKGTKLEVDNSVLKNLGIKGISVFTMMGGMRSDYMHDINALRPYRLNPKKLLTLANRSRLLGYDTPMDDPVFSAFYKAHQAKRGKELTFNSTTFEFELPETSRLRRAANAIVGKGTPNSKSVVSIGPKGLVHRGRTLNKLPQYGEFGHSFAGGVEFSRLKGTIFDRRADGRLLFLDLGETLDISVGGKKTAMRYLPIPTEYLRTGTGSGGRLVVSSGHPAEEYVKIINAIEAGASPKTMVGSIGKAVTKFGQGLGQGDTASRRGMIENLNTVLVPTGVRARLIPQRGRSFTRGNFADANGLFNIYTTQTEIADILTRKSGMDAAGVNKILAEIEKNKFAHVLLNVDPTQRPEHNLLVRLMIKKNKGVSTNGMMGIEMHPLVFRMLERDTDRDVANLVFMSVFGADHDALEKQIAKQTEKINPFLWWYKYELAHGGSVKKDFRLKKAMKNSKDRVMLELHGVSEALGFDKFASYLSQKMEASSGYTITRAVDKLLNPLAFGSEQRLAEMGIDPRIAQSVAHYRSVTNGEKLGVSSALAQALYQGGVQKGAKSSLLEVREGLMGLREKVNANPTMSFDEIKTEATEIFDRFLISQADKRREFMAAPYLIDRLRKKGKITDSTEQILKDLERELGSTINRASGKTSELLAFNRKYSELQGMIRREAAEVLAETFGFGSAIMSFIKRKPKGIIDLLQRKIRPEGVMGVMNDLTETTPSSLGISEKVVEKAASKAEGFAKLLKNKNLLAGIGIGIGAIGAAALARTVDNFFDDSDSIMNVDESYPMDRGPILPNLSNRAPLYTSNSQIYSPVNIGRESSFSSLIPGFGGRSYTDMVVRDRTNSRNDYLMTNDLRRNSNSDF